MLTGGFFYVKSGTWAVFAFAKYGMPFLGREMGGAVAVLDKKLCGTGQNRAG